MREFSIIKNRVLGILREQLPEKLKYHSVHHTLYVLDKCMLIAKKEKLSTKDTFLLKTAALYHDIGFVNGSKDHEESSCKIARKQLKADGFAKEEIDKVCGMIMATKIPQEPKNYIENILADADLEYLGTRGFWKIGELLYQELRFDYKDMTREQWNKIQISFLEKHQYHTKFCRQYREKYKRQHLIKLRALVA